MDDNGISDISTHYSNRWLVYSSYIAVTHSHIWNVTVTHNVFTICIYIYIYIYICICRERVGERDKSSLLYKGMTFAIFNCSGKIPWERDKLQMWVSGFTRNCEDIFRHIAFRSSNPAAVSFNDFINCPISFSLTGAKYMDSVKRLPK